MNITVNRDYAATWQQSALVAVPSVAAFGMRGLCTTGIDGVQTTDPKAGHRGSLIWSPPIT